jgi:hypothetical protein
MWDENTKETVDTIENMRDIAEKYLQHLAFPLYELESVEMDGTIYWKPMLNEDQLTE